VTARSVIHDTFTIERTYPATPGRVFASFASAKAKNIWGDAGGLKPASDDDAISEFDFRPGGRERFRFSLDGTTYRCDARYYDIVPDQRIIYAYEMYANDARISVSVATIEFVKKEGDGTTLIHTEQGAYFYNTEGPGRHPLRGVRGQALPRDPGHPAARHQPALSERANDNGVSHGRNMPKTT
jgi:uncharacterized protein YndB with AHSA1/START domain